MFDPSTRYVTQGIVNTVPRPTQNLLWLLLKRMSVGRRDALQVFRLKAESDKQSVMHTQENPCYQKEFAFNCSEAITTKIYIIDDGTHNTMLLADEY